MEMWQGPRGGKPLFTSWLKVEHEASTWRPSFFLYRPPSAHTLASSMFNKLPPISIKNIEPSNLLFLASNNRLFLNKIRSNQWSLSLSLCLLITTVLHLATCYKSFVLYITKVENWTWLKCQTTHLCAVQKKSVNLFLQLKGWLILMSKNKTFRFIEIWHWNRCIFFHWCS